MRDELTLPANVEAERAVLGSLLIDESAYPKVAQTLRPADFYVETHRWLFSAIGYLAELRKPLDTVTITDELERRGQLTEVGGPAFVVDLGNATPTAMYVEHYAEIVARTATQRRIIAAAGEIAKIGYDSDRDIDDAIEAAEGLVFGVNQGRDKGNMVSLSESLRKTMNNIDQAASNPDHGVGLTTGFTMLDRMLGGLQKSDLIILAARPGMGKSSLALTVARESAKRQGARVAIFSLEMSSEQMTQRLLSMESSIDSHRIRLGAIETDEWPILMEAANSLNDLHIHIDDTPGASVSDVRAKCRRLYAEHGLDMIIIDYLQLMSGPGKNHSENRHEEISYISRSLKALARELNVPIIALSQLSRAVEQRADKRPMLSDLRECVIGDTMLVDAETGKPVAIRDVRKGMRVLGLGDDQKIVATTVYDAWMTGVKDVYELKTRTGRSIAASANHPFLTSTGWKKLEELSSDDLIATALQYPAHGQEKPENADLCRLLGYLAGNGSVKKHRCISFCGRDRGQVDDVVGIVTSHFPEVQWRDKEIGENYIDGYFARVFDNGYGRPGANPLIEWIKAVGIYDHIDSDKFVPDIVFESGFVGAVNFLSGYLATDGCIKKRRRGRWTAHFDTTSRRLALDVMHLLTRIGVSSSVSNGAFNTKSTKPIYRLAVSEQDGNMRRFLNLMSVPGIKGDRIAEAMAMPPANDSGGSLLMLPKHVSSLMAQKSKGRLVPGQGWRDQKKSPSRRNCRRYAEALGDQELLVWADSDLLWERVESVTHAGQEETYDICVDTANFIGNGIVAHNSGALEQDADIVLFIYREDYYIEDSDKQNIADVIIAKHRHGSTGTVSLYFRKELTQFRDLEIERTELNY